MYNIKEVVEGLRSLRESPRKGLPTGLEDLDSRIHGLIPSELTLIGAFSAMGKSAFLGQLVCNLMKDFSVDVWSLELDKEVFLNRLVCNLAEVEFYPLINNELNEEDNERAENVMDELCSLPININKWGYVTPQKVYNYMQNSQPDIVFIDRLAFLSCEERDMPDYKQKESICKKLQSIAEECEIPIVMAAQMTMSSEEAHRNGGEMVLSEFRGAKAIKDYSRCCLGINRPGYYVNDPEDTRCYIEIMKKTNAISGRVECKYIGKHFKFVNKEDSVEEEIELGDFDLEDE